MKSIFLPTLCCFIVVSLSAQTSKVFDNLSMKSAILKSDRKYAIYLPPDYETSQRHYPVLYLLHGGGDNQTGWVQFGEVQYIMDKALKEGTATPMIVVMPDAMTGVLGYYNTIDGNWRYEDFFFEEFMPYVEKTYRIRSEKRYRAIAGLSMGGGGSFVYALHRPDLFSSACPLSAWLPTIDGYKDFLTRQNIKYAENQLQPYFEKYNAIELVGKIKEEDKKAVRWYFDCGDDDFLYEGNSLMHIAMRKNDIPHEYRVRDGGHTWTFWRESLPIVLSFISDSFHQN